MKNHSVSSIIAVLISIASACIALYGNVTARDAVRTAEMANSIAERATHLQYSSMQPLVTAETAVVWDQDGIQTERLIVRNNGHTASEFRIRVFTFIEIYYRGSWYALPLLDYYPERYFASARSQGILVSMEKHGNYSDYQRFRTDFEAAARNDGYDCDVCGVVTYIVVTGKDALGDGFERYLYCSETMYSQLDAQYFQDSKEQARANANRLATEGLEIASGNLSATDLWNRYRSEILPGVDRAFSEPQE